MQNDDWTQKRKDELFDEARNAADRRDLPRLSNAHQKLTSFYALLKQLEAIQPESLSGNPPTNPILNEILPVPVPRIGESDKERGERVRTEWVSANLPSALTPVRGALYKKNNGDIVGIAYGEEKKNREDRWFLGLPADRFHCAVLLCRVLTGNLFWVTLPSDFISKYKSQFSRSKASPQVKFSLFKKAQNYCLRVPGIGPVLVTEYINKLP